MFIVIVKQVNMQRDDIRKQVIGIELNSFFFFFLEMNPILGSNLAYSIQTRIRIWANYSDQIKL